MCGAGAWHSMVVLERAAHRMCEIRRICLVTCSWMEREVWQCKWWPADGTHVLYWRVGEYDAGEVGTLASWAPVTNRTCSLRWI